MIQFKNTEIFGIDGAIRGMRHPFKSTEKTDSNYCNGKAVKENKKLCAKCPYLKVNVFDNGESEHAVEYSCESKTTNFIIGQNDFKLAQKLAKAGTDHGKFLRMIHVQCDITAPLYWWKQMVTYSVGVTINSESTMHTLLKHSIDYKDFSCDKILEIPILQSCFDDLINTIEGVRVDGENWGYTKEEIFNALVQILPEGYNQTRTWDANYAVLKNIYHARKNHKLKEWQDFCNWIETLPYSELITE